MDVAPRDGLQSQPTLVSTEQKVELIRRSIEAGARRLEVVSFVKADRVPQMADASEVLAHLGKPHGVTLIGLTLNEKGVERAIKAGLDEINVVANASDTFSMKNQGCDSAESVARATRMVDMACQAGVRAQIVISAAFGCPFEGEVSLDQVRRVVEGCAATDASELCLADTIGAAAPSDVHQRFELAREVAPSVRWRAHFHNTRGAAVANVFAAIAEGIDSFDASLGGVGGCPFAPKATGNVAIEDLVFSLHRGGYCTGYDLDKLIQAARWLGVVVGDGSPSALSRAGSFPAPHPPSPNG